ncbi:MAG: tandem-95 repeat protein, partial [Chloroflexi bacterium]|nr:tandem-95 repeat protein [Chloroflexota bacterium]
AVAATDVENDPLTFSVVDDVDHGTLLFNPDGSFTYTPNLNFNGSDSFTFKANDGTDDSNVATVTITVTPVNDAPLAVEDCTPGYTTDEDIALNGSSVLANDSDIDGDTLTAVLVSTTTNGTLAFNSDGTFTYTPNLNFNGSDSFSYNANDGTADSNVVSVCITVTPVNDAPVALPDSYNMTEDTVLIVDEVDGVLANDSDPDNDPLTAELVLGPVNGTLMLNPDGSFTYTPNANFNGSDTFTYRASDGNLYSNDPLVTITITAANDSPTADNDSYTVAEDMLLSVTAPGVLGNDSDLDGDTLTAVLVSTTSNGTLALNADGSFTYTPNTNYCGGDSFSYKANDGMADSNVATVTITVDCVNDAPVAVNDSYSTAEDTPLNGTTVLVNDSDADTPYGDTFTAVLVSTTTNGTLAFNSDGTFTYTPNANFNGSDSFTYRAYDGEAYSDIATVTITVNAVNDAPMAVADCTPGYTTDEDIALNGSSVLANDSDPDGDTLTAVLVSTTSNGTLAFNSDGTFSYTPNLNFNGSDSFSYNANDGTVDSNVVSVCINVTPVNDAPVAQPDSYSTAINTVKTVSAPGVLANDSDIDSSFSVSAYDAVSANGGTISMNPNGSFSYTPPLNFVGFDTFTYTISDGSLTSTATVTINVLGEAVPAECANINFSGPAIIGTNRYDELYGTEGNDLIFALGGSDDIYGLGGDDCIVAGRGLDNVWGGEGNDVILGGQGNDDMYGEGGNDRILGEQGDDFLLGGSGNDILLGGQGSDCVFGQDGDDYIDGGQDHDAPLVGGNGNDVIFGGQGHDELYGDAYMGSSQNSPHAQFVDASGVPGNDQLFGQAGNDDLYGGEGNDLLDGDTGDDALYAEGGDDILTGGARSDEFYGGDGSGDVATDYDAHTDDICVDVEVGCATPLAVNDGYTTDEDTVLNGASVLANDNSPEDEPLTAALVSTTSNGTLTLNPDGTFTYTPNADFNGSDSFTYQAFDGMNLSNIVTVTITVNPVNDTPLATNDDYTTDEDTALNGSSVLANDSDVDGDLLAAALVSTTSNGTLTFNADSSFTYMPNTNYCGGDSFSYKANDGTDDSNVATVTITVDCVNDAPVAVNDSYTTDEDNVLNGSSVLANDSDPDGDTLTAVLMSGPTNGTLALNPDGTFTYTPNADFNGSDSFTYKANDGTDDSNIATVDITVNPVVDDADGDGFGDDNGADQCVGTFGTINGCPDDDADSIVNSGDLCPTTPGGEPVNGDGCSDSQLDNDSDGLSNAAEAALGTDPNDDDSDDDTVIDSVDTSPLDPNQQ